MNDTGKLMNFKNFCLYKLDTQWCSLHLEIKNVPNIVWGRDVGGDLFVRDEQSPKEAWTGSRIEKFDFMV